MNTILFFSAGQTTRTPAVVEAVIAGDYPKFLNLKTEENSWMKNNGYSKAEYTSVVFPQAGYATTEASDDQVAELINWLDRVSPEWRAKMDGYGNKSVQIINSVAHDPLENLVSPEARGDYL